MSFSDLLKNPSETALLTTILGLLVAENLTTAESAVLGRLIIYFGEALLTVSVLQAAYEQEKLAASPHKAVMACENAEASITLDSILLVIKQLQQENQSFQEQIWALQEQVSSR